MEIGDYITCKKTLKINIVYFYKNKKYKIINMYDKTITICDETTKDSNGFNFRINKNNDDTHKLYDYFYSQEEFRKLKLNTILK